MELSLKRVFGLNMLMYLLVSKLYRIQNDGRISLYGLFKNTFSPLFSKEEIAIVVQFLYERTVHTGCIQMKLLQLPLESLFLKSHGNSLFL